MKELSEVHPPKDWAGCVGLSVEVSHHPAVIASYFGIEPPRHPRGQEDVGIWRNIQTQRH